MTSNPEPIYTPEDLFAKRLKAARWLSKQGYGIVLLPVPLNGDCQCPPKSTTRTNGGPCRSPGKHPLGQDWEHSAAHTKAEIDALVTAPHLRIMRQFGIFPEPGSGLLVLDEDQAGALRAICDEYHITVPPTFTVMTSVDPTTGERKRHYYYRLPEGYDPKDVPKTWIGGEVRVEGSGQVVGPWSLHHSGAIYEPEPGTPAEIATLPVEFILVMKRLVGERTRKQVENAALVIHAGEGRHEFLVQSGRFLWKGGIRGDALIEKLVELDQTRCNPSYGRGEMLRLADWLEKNLEEPWVPITLNVPYVGATAPAGLRIVHEDDGFAPPRVTDFPDDPDPAAFDGVAGMVAKDLALNSSASVTGLLMATLTFWGGLFGDYFDLYEAQPTNIFAVLVGDTARARKGTATRNVWTAFQKALDTPGTINPIDRYQWGGLASGQALLRQMQEAGEVKKGVSIEEEFETVLRGARSTRDYNSILNTIINKAWDGRMILHHTASKTNSYRVEPPYTVGILGNITREVLRSLLPPEMIHGGFANRLLWVPVRGSDHKVDPTRPVGLEPSVSVLVSKARDWRNDTAYTTPIFTTPAGDLIEDYYQFLETAGGAYAKFTPRLHVMAARLAMIHALMDRSYAVTPEYISRGIALTEYCRTSLLWTFSDETGDDRVDYLIDLLRVRPDGMTAREYRAVFKDPAIGKRVQRQALQAGLVEVRVAPPSGAGSKGGRPTHLLGLSEMACASLSERFVEHKSGTPPETSKDGDDDIWMGTLVRGDLNPTNPPTNPPPTPLEDPTLFHKPSED